MKVLSILMTALVGTAIWAQEAETEKTTTPTAEVLEKPAEEEPAEETTVDGKTMPVELFLQYMRYPRVQNSWMKMDGRLENKSKAGYFKTPIEVRGWFQPDSWRMQLIISRWERWFIRQNFNDGEFGTSKLQEKKPIAGERSLAEYGIKPEDITLSFLYWDFVKEESPEEVSGQHCRVIRLKDRDTEEEALVWVSTKYIFTMKVQWFKKGGKTFERELLFKDFNIYKPKSDSDIKIAMVEELRIQGPGWKTKIVFEKPVGDLVNDELPLPDDLFLKDQETKEEKVEE